MTKRQRLHELVDQLSEAEVEVMARLIASRRGVGNDRDHPEMAELPEAWRTFDDGSPAPNWVALLDEVRSAHR